MLNKRISSLWSLYGYVCGQNIDIAVWVGDLFFHKEKGCFQFMKGNEIQPNLLLERRQSLIFYGLFLPCTVLYYFLSTSERFYSDASLKFRIRSKWSSQDTKSVTSIDPYYLTSQGARDDFRVTSNQDLEDSQCRFVMKLLLFLAVLKLHHFFLES